MTNKPLIALRVVTALAMASGQVTYAQADSLIDGTFNFVKASNIIYPLPTASFVWDSTTNKWNSFTVNWNGAVFNFATVFPNLQAVALDGRWCGQGPNVGKACFAAVGAGFGLQLHFNPLGISPEQPTWTDVDAFGYGGYTVKETAVTAATTSPSPLPPPPGARGCGRASGRQQERDDGHDCGRDRGGPHGREMTTARTAVPEPATLGLMILGLLGGAGLAGRRRRH